MSARRTFLITLAAVGVVAVALSAGGGLTSERQGRAEQAAEGWTTPRVSATRHQTALDGRSEAGGSDRWLRLRVSLLVVLPAAAALLIGSARKRLVPADRTTFPPLARWHLRRSGRAPPALVSALT